jgi:hypothetical protein
MGSVWLLPWMKSVCAYVLLHVWLVLYEWKLFCVFGRIQRGGGGREGCTVGGGSLMQGGSGGTTAGLMLMAPQNRD